MPFRDRRHAGQALAAALQPLAGTPVVVVGLPRGGVPVAAEVAASLHAPLDVLVVRKLGVPFQPELGMGAIGEEGIVVLNDALVERAGVTRDDIDAVAAREAQELARRVARYRAGRAPVPVDGRTVVVVDDGLATGFTARAAVEVARHPGAARVVLAVPVGAPDSVAALRELADDVVCVEAPADLMAVGYWYEDFSPTTDEEVVDALTASGSASSSAEATVAAGSVGLPGALVVPAGASGVVVFAHGSGSSRHSPRNVQVAEGLRRAGFATLLFDLLTADEATDRALVFDIPLLAGRLVAAARWLGDGPAAGLPVGFFGASTGGGAALWAAAELGDGVAAVVSRGGRPDLAGQRLPDVTAPTLLIVGERDDVVLDLNRDAAAQLRCEHELAVVPGATHLFEEPGAIEEVARHATDWFATHLGRH